MVKRTMTAPNDEPEQRKFELPSEGEHQFQVVDLWTDKMDDNIIIVKLEVSEGEELGRSILHRVNLDSTWKGFFLTRLFLKAINEPYKGDIETDEDMWIGKIFYATIIHNLGNNGKTYANIDQFNFDKVVEQFDAKKDTPDTIQWDEK
jgi:hypothetical protein